MLIYVKSEVDSRVLLYPLIRTLWNYGSMLVISSNPMVRRLFDEEGSNSFRNVTVVVDEEGAADDIYKANGIDSSTYDFVVLDNIGATEYDLCLVPLGNKHKPEFDEDVALMVSGEDTAKVHLFQFGTPVKKTTERKTTQKSKEDEEYDPASKWHEVDPNANKDAQNKVHKVKFPTYEFIETVEAEHKFPVIGSDLMSAFYDIFGETFKVTITQFRKEVQAKDENSGYIGTVDSSWNE